MGSNCLLFIWQLCMRNPKVKVYCSSPVCLLFCHPMLFIFHGMNQQCLSVVDISLPVLVEVGVWTCPATIWRCELVTMLSCHEQHSICYCGSTLLWHDISVLWAIGLHDVYYIPCPFSAAPRATSQPHTAFTECVHRYACSVTSSACSLCTVSTLHMC